MPRINVLAENKIKYVNEFNEVPYSGVLMPEPYYREYVENSMLLLDCEQVDQSLIKEYDYQSNIIIFLSGLALGLVTVQNH